MSAETSPAAQAFLYFLNNLFTFNLLVVATIVTTTSLLAVALPPSLLLSAHVFLIDGPQRARDRRRQRRRGTAPQCRKAAAPEAKRENGREGAKKKGALASLSFDARLTAGGALDIARVRLVSRRARPSPGCTETRGEKRREGERERGRGKSLKGKWRKRRQAFHRNALVLCTPAAPRPPRRTPPVAQAPAGAPGPTARRRQRRSAPPCRFPFFLLGGQG